MCPMEAVMESIVSDLVRFGFTPTEAEVYAVLVKLGCANGSQIAKEMNISRSSVYQALNSLYKGGRVYLQQGNSAEYMPKEPDLLIAALQKEYEAAAGALQKKLKVISQPNEGLSFTNISGMENVYRRASEMIESSQKELLFNTTRTLERYTDEILDAHKRGVRIIVFSFDPIDMADLPVEFYRKNIEEDECCEERLQLVVDFSSCLIASHTPSTGEAIGTYTRNPLQVAIVTEHIHHDIYILKLTEKYGDDLFKDGILMGTLMEKQRWLY